MNSSQLLMNRSEVEFLTPTPMTVLAFSRSLLTKRREIRVAAQDDEGIDVALGVAQVERVDDHADVGGILAGLAHVRDFDEFERRLVQSALEVLVALEIAVGLLDHDVALEQQSLEHLLDVETRILGIARAEGDVLQIEEDRHGGVGGFDCHCA